ncbi:hypothetical protein Pcinc_016796 [Petrolisthes cinctipes]|uniref:Protein cramped-like n=1 Tax=Petrolisthes cinctipes TaxID=88211 RepID=A0AAE1FVH0_PETCI|nr:hypothetical protein Pcinc_016796 [Petrolisthes cinctipes]
MVKRKRTLSIKENSDSVHQCSEANQGKDDAKRPKITNHVNSGGIEGGDGVVVEVTTLSQNHTTLPLATATTKQAITTTTTNTTNGLPLPSSLGAAPPMSQQIPLVPSLAATPSVLPQARPTQQLRTSARVLNKQRREETSKAEPTTTTQSTALAKKVETSAGGDADFPDEEDGIGKKRRRAWELWSLDDKNIFFESINECGKDFEAIQAYLTAKLRKKGAPRSQVKNKDQVRHFYYRTWHKISKYITFNEGVKKATQELYGLINFGELRKKIGGNLDERRALKLQELIRKGSTSVRVRGKSIRVRTPICRALKKLNQIDEHREHTELRVPTSVVVEIVPGSVQAWCHVQGLAHNPRVRLNCPLQRTLNTILVHLQQKWRNARLKLLDTLSTRVTFPLELPTTPEPVLRLLPARGITIKPVSVQSEVVLKSSFVSLSSHEARLRRRGEKVGRPSRRREPRQKDSHGEKQKETRGDKPALGETRQQKAGRERRELGGEEEGAAKEEDERIETEGEGEKKEGGERERACLEKGGGGGGGSGELEDLGEASQEEPDDLSDGEVDCLNSDDNDTTPGQVFSPDKLFSLAQVKEEPPDTILSPPQDEAFDPDVRVKEEGEGDALRQLLALETAAGAGMADDDGEVVCTGESTRLTAHVPDAHNKATTHPSQSNDDDQGATGSPDPEEEEGRSEGGMAGQQGGATEGQDTEALVQKLRAGWTLADVGGITVGELYLMLGQNRRICLEYEFADASGKIKDSTTENSSSNNNNDDNITNNNNKNTCNNSTINKSSNSNTTMSSNTNSTHTNTTMDVGRGIEIKVGKVNGICGLGEGESASKSVDAQPGVTDPSKGNNGTGDGGAPLMLLPSTGSSLDVPGVSTSTVVAVGTDSSQQAKDMDGNWGAVNGEGQVGKSEEEEKKIALVENLSGMLSQLLSMAKTMMAKSSGESSCPCGHVCGRTGNLLRSPAGGRGQGPGGLGRSPGNSRSPRTGRLAAATTTQSSGQASPGPLSASRSPLAAPRPLRERNKPTSAKRLITDTMEHHSSIVEGKVGEVCSEPVVLPPTSTTTTTTAAGPTTPTPDQLAVGGMGLVGGGGGGGFMENKIVVGGEGTGEFKVPLGPAPRQLHVQQANFNAQLTKLLPRYTTRPGRRVVRKNVVHRQLPLLPKNIIQPVTMRVLQSQPSGQKDGVGRKFVPITMTPPVQTVSPSPSPSPSQGAFSVRPILSPSPTNPVLSWPVVQSLRSPVNYGTNQSIQSLTPQSSSSIVQPLKSLVNQGNSLIVQPQKSQVNHNQVISLAQPAVNQSTNQILQSVPLTENVTTPAPVQLSVVSPRPTVTSPAITPLEPGANAISVNISGQPLMTVEMPTMLPQVTETASKPAPGKQDADSTTLTSSKLLQSSQDHTIPSPTSHSNGLLSSMVSQVLSELPDLSTPPGTPQPSPVKSVSAKRSFEEITSVVVSTSGQLSGQLPSSLELFTTPLSSDPLPTLDTTLATTSPLTLSCTLSPIMSLSTLSPVASSSLSNTTQLTLATTQHLELSPPPSKINGISSLLNTPTPQSCIDQSHNSPIRMPPSISSLLSSSTDLIAKSFPTILGADDSVDATLDRSGNSVPELHIPEGSVNIPSLLDISIGGTVTLSEQVPGLLSSNTDPEDTLGVPLVSSSATPTPTTAVTTMVGAISLQDSSSSDKLLDITLGNSNSNSSFSSLLAAATQSRQLDPSSLLDQASLDTGACALPGTESSGGGEAQSTGEGLTGGGLAGFPQLSSVPMSPPSSPSRLLQQTDTQWLNNEVNDFSLSSFLGHLESPVKNNGSNSRGAGSSSQTTAQPQTPVQPIFIPSLSSVFNENSVDFTATFAEMKAQVSETFKQ